MGWGENDGRGGDDDVAIVTIVDTHCEKWWFPIKLLEFPSSLLLLFRKSPHKLFIWLGNIACKLHIFYFAFFFVGGPPIVLTLWIWSWVTDLTLVKSGCQNINSRANKVLSGRHNWPFDQFHLQHLAAVQVFLSLIWLVEICSNQTKPNQYYQIPSAGKYYVLAIDLSGSPGNTGSREALLPFARLTHSRTRVETLDEHLSTHGRTRHGNLNGDETFARYSGWQTNTSMTRNMC